MPHMYRLQNVHQDVHDPHPEFFCCNDPHIPTIRAVHKGKLRKDDLNMRSVSATPPIFTENVPFEI